MSSREKRRSKARATALSSTVRLCKASKSATPLASRQTTSASWPYRSGVRQRRLQFLESALVGGVVAKPFLASSDKRPALGYPSIVNALLPPQGYGDGVLVRVGRIAFAQIVGTDRYCDLFALIDIDYGQTFDFHGGNSCTQLILFPTM